jgi:hypothetical protein
MSSYLSSNAKKDYPRDARRFADIHCSAVGVFTEFPREAHKP